MRVVAGEFKNLTVGETTGARDYPPGAALRVENMVFEPDGTVRRRPGMQCMMAWRPLDTGRAVGIAHQLGNAHIIFESRGGNLTGVYACSDEGMAYTGPGDSAKFILKPNRDDVQMPNLSSIRAVGPSAAIGDFHIMPAVGTDGAPYAKPTVNDVTLGQRCIGIASFQVTHVQQQTRYDLTITVERGGRLGSLLLWVRAPSLDYPGVLQVADIPAVLADGRANPNYSRDVAQRQAEHARARANWVRTVAPQLTPPGIAPFFQRAHSQRKAVASDNDAIDFGWDGDQWARDAATVETSDTRVSVSFPNGYRIMAIRKPVEWKGVSGSTNTQEALPAVGADGQIVLVGRTDLVLEADLATKQWKERPRMNVFGELPLIAVSSATVGSHADIITRSVRYGEIAPTPTAAPTELAIMLTTAGAPVRTMYISGRFCVVCEHAILVSAANRPLDFFPRSSSTITPADGTIVEVSSSSAEFIVDALPVRSGAFVLTNLGAYTVQVADTTKIVIQKVRDTSFPANAAHSIANINGDIWHYWRTKRDHAIRIYTESDYGQSWSSSNPTPHYEMSAEAVPEFGQVVGTSSGDTVYLILGNRIKVMTRVGNSFAVSTITQDAGKIKAAYTHGDDLILYIESFAGSLLLCRYDKTATTGNLDAWAYDSLQAPLKYHAQRGNYWVPYHLKDQLLGSDSDPITVGSLFSSGITLLPPPAHRVSTPSAWATMCDVAVTVRNTWSFRISDGYRIFDYSGGVRATDNMLWAKPDTFRVVHPIYRTDARPITIGSVSPDSSHLAPANLEITSVTYTMTVAGDKTPSAWG